MISESIKDQKTIKGQTSMELMIYVGIALVILGYIFIFLYPQSNRSINEMSSYYADLLASTLASNVNSVQNLGAGSEYTMRLSVQKGVEGIFFNNSGIGGEVTVVFNNQGKIVDIVKPVGATFCNGGTNGISLSAANMTSTMYVKISNDAEKNCIHITKLE